jgi:hypothetical protein
VSLRSNEGLAGLGRRDPSASTERSREPASLVFERLPAVSSCGASPKLRRRWTQRFYRRIKSTPTLFCHQFRRTVVGGWVADLAFLAWRACAHSWPAAVLVDGDKGQVHGLCSHYAPGWASRPLCFFCFWPLSFWFNLSVRDNGWAIRLT